MPGAASTPRPPRSATSLVQTLGVTLCDEDRVPQLCLGTDFVWNRPWPTPSLRTSSKTVETLAESS